MAAVSASEEDMASKSSLVLFIQCKEILKFKEKLMIIILT